MCDRRVLGLTLKVAVVALALVLAVACWWDDDDPIPSDIGADFISSGTPAARNQVRLRLGSASGDRLILEVVIGGPTASQDIYGFAFDLVLGDPAVAQYVSGSAEAGTALTGQNLLVEAGPQPNDPGILVVSVSKQGAVAGNGITVNDEVVVVRLGFEVLLRRVTSVEFAGRVSAQNPSGEPAALDSTGAVIDTIQFDSESASIVGR